MSHSRVVVFATEEKAKEAITKLKPSYKTVEGPHPVSSVVFDDQVKPFERTVADADKVWLVVARP